MKNSFISFFSKVGLVFLVFFAYYTGVGCPFKFFLGIPCPGCGMTRALFSLLRLDFKTATKYHPLWILVLLIVIVFIVVSFFHIKKAIFISNKTKNVIIILIAFTFILVYIIRVINKDPVVMPNFKNGFIYRILNYIFPIVR